jgi:hypothetical protein
MAGASKHNGEQTQAMLRELQALRGDMRALKARQDRAVALADAELGATSIAPSTFGQGADLAPIVYPMGLPDRRASEGARGMPSGMGDAGVTAPLRPAPAPVPGSLRIAADLKVGATGGSAARGEMSATFGVSGTPITSGFLLDLGEYNPELMGRNAIPTYERMRRSDAQVRATLAACKLPILSAKWEIMPGETAQSGVRSSESKTTGPQTQDLGRRTKEIAEFVKQNLFGGLEFQSSTGAWVSQSWQSVVYNALLMLDFGCAIHEDVWTVHGDQIKLRCLPARLPLTFYRWHTEADGETLLAVEQYGYRRQEFLNCLLPADKMARFTYQQEGANFWGIALQRAMYPHWYIKSKLYRLDAIANERNSLGVPVFRLAPGFSAQDKEAAYSYVTQLAAHEATGLVEPPGDATTGFRIVGTQGEVRDVAPSIQHHNEMISRAALNTFMDLGQSAHGSRALGATAADFFMLGLQSVADQIALDITNSTIRRLVALNFGDDAPCPRLVAGNVQARSVADMIGDLVSLAQQGLIVSENNVRKHIREKFALPEESAEGIVVARGETIDVGTLAGSVSGRSGGAIAAAANKPAESVGAGSATRRAAQVEGEPQILQIAQKQQPDSAGSVNVQASEKAEGRSRTVPSPFWRPGDPGRLRLVHPNETHIDFPAHEAELDRCEAAIAGILREAKAKMARAVADKVAAAMKRGQSVNAIAAPEFPQVAAAIGSQLSRTFNEGRRHARLEDGRLKQQETGTKFVARAVALLADDYDDDDEKRKNALALLLRITMGDITADQMQTARKAAIDLERTGQFDGRTAPELADELFYSVEQTAYLAAGIDRAAAEASREAWNAGRAAELESPVIDIRGDLYREVRIALIDKNTCGPCAGADGQPWDPAKPLGLICEGGALCRCEPVRELIRRIV